MESSLPIAEARFLSEYLAQKTLILMLVASKDPSKVIVLRIDHI